ncbi:integrase domain-containing protein [Pandoraea sp.]|uniref:integrase domain-containing protein n=1 Tax=Pandoraea sp. TaxID=1883445 RepID=UPI0025F59432|nr:integrase domain-containing protein [Pandoraea sp.]
MATFSSARHGVRLSNERRGGASGTKKNRRSNLNGFLSFCRNVGELRPRFSEINPVAVQFYASYLMAEGMRTATLPNVFSSIRVIFREAGRNIDEICSNSRLGIPRRSRSGTKRALTTEEVEALIVRCEQRGEVGLSLLIKLSRHLGLRRKEALMCARDLPMWRAAIVHGDNSLPTLRGTKNGRRRAIEIMEGERDQTLSAIDEALEYAREKDFKFISGGQDNLKSAIGRMAYLLSSIGMRGEVSFHALRYSYAQTKAMEMLNAGVSPDETLVRVSESLGHGPSRIPMILAVYCQPLKPYFKGKLKPKKGEAHNRQPTKKIPRASLRIQVKAQHAQASGFPVGRIQPVHL